MKRETFAQRCLCAAMFVAGAYLGRTVLILSGCDSEDDLWVLRFLDLMVGSLFATAFWLNRLDQSGTSAAVKNNRSSMRLAVCLFVFVSGGLMLFQLFGWYARMSGSLRAVARNDVVRIFAALDEYRADHGTYPTTEQGLGVLLATEKQRPTSDFDAGDLIDPWDRALQYRNENGVIRVWSLGRDGLDGTEDDIVGTRNVDGP